MNPFFEEEIKKAMFSLGSDRAPGLDSFLAAFFQHFQEIVGPDVVEAIKEVQESG